MNITQNMVVRFHYTLKDETGQHLESTTGSDPVTYLHGHNNLLSGLENALEGKSKGDKASVTLQPEDAFGEHRPGNEQTVPLKYLMGSDDWKPGMIAVVNTDQGQRQVRILKVEDESATVDTNHPLAGKVLTFDVEVIEVRKANHEELSHGHVHGEGGHHH